MSSLPWLGASFLTGWAAYARLRGVKAREPRKRFAGFDIFWVRLLGESQSGPDLAGCEKKK